MQICIKRFINTQPENVLEKSRNYKTQAVGCKPL